MKDSQDERRERRKEMDTLILNMGLATMSVAVILKHEHEILQGIKKIL